jgi:adhesin/invasin
MAAGAATSVTVKLSPASIVANGTSTSTATATVTGATSAADAVTFASSGAAVTLSGAKAKANGTFTATVTSSTTAGSATITATDTRASVSGSAKLTLTSPPPPPPPPSPSMTLKLSPTSIPANGVSTSTATATVTESGKPEPGHTVVFYRADRGTFATATTGSKGNATVTITSSTTVGRVTITATDQSLSPNLSQSAVLNQTAPSSPPPRTPASPSTTKLSTAPTAPVTNQQVTLIATVTSSTSTAPSGTVTFENGGAPIGGCANEPVSTQGAIITCVTSFAASTSPARLAAVFTPGAGSSVAGSSAADSLVVDRDSTSTTLSVPSAGIVKLGASITYTATIASTHGGAFETGSVAFEDGGTPIPGCASQPIGTGPAATCTISYTKTGTHDITAVYSGDANFGGSASSPGHAVGVVKASAEVLGIVGSTMQWTFLFTPSYTKVLALVVDSAPFGSSVVIQCKGGGCPFTKRSLPVNKPKPCHRTSKHKCSPPSRSGTIHLLARFRGHHLQVGARIMVKVVRPHWIGKYYAFVMRARRAPQVQVACLAPGSSRPGVGC